MDIINSQTSNSYNNYSLGSNNYRSSEKTANNMPNGLIKVPEVQNNKNITNNLDGLDLRQIYSTRLAPSSGSMTVNFLKARSNLSPIFKFNEAATRYEMISSAPLTFTEIKKSIDIMI